eukprot:31354-Pelagococcus_subviridis.AAC.4
MQGYSTCTRTAVQYSIAICASAARRKLGEGSTARQVVFIGRVHRQVPWTRFYMRASKRISLAEFSYVGPDNVLHTYSTCTAAVHVHAALVATLPEGSCVCFRTTLGR